MTTKRGQYTRYEATFTPEVWMNDNAVEVDPQGVTTWDCTVAVIGEPAYFAGLPNRTGGNYADGVTDNDDVLKRDPLAPEWIREWSGPFTITVRIVETTDPFGTVYVDGEAFGFRVQLMRADDGAMLVQIDTKDEPYGEHVLRVYVNDGRVFDGEDDPSYED